MIINPKLKITSIEQVREYALAYRLITGMSIEEEVFEEETTELDPEDTTEAPKRRGTRTPNHKGAAERYADWEPASSGCLSGSGEEVPQGGRFASGGQHKLTAIAGAVNARLLSFDKIAPHAWKYLLDSNKYPNVSEMIREQEE